MYMQTMASFRPNNHKNAIIMLIYGLILTIQSSTESLKCVWSYGKWIDYNSVLQNDDRSISWYMIPVLLIIKTMREVGWRLYYRHWVVARDKHEVLTVVVQQKHRLEVMCAVSTKHNIEVKVWVSDIWWH